MIQSSRKTIRKLRYIARTASQDERYTDVDSAINDAFKRARRCLQDHVRRMQGHVKEHEAQPIGKVIGFRRSQH